MGLTTSFPAHRLMEAGASSKATALADAPAELIAWKEHCRLGQVHDPRFDSPAVFWK
jgi:hypothetical protein